MNNLISKLINIAKNEVGVKEDPGKNNMGKRIIEYQKATWLHSGPWPWCAAFTAWIMKEWLKDEEVLKALNLDTYKSEVWRCRDARAFGWEEWAKRNELKILPEETMAKAGDFVIFDFSHIGLVIEDRMGKMESKIKTIEGNTNGKGERDSISGDGVWMKERKYTLVKCYIRIFESSNLST